MVDVSLSRPDLRLDLFLTESCAKILLPQSHRSEQFDRFPIGCGPYKVTRNDDKRLTLQAFDGYFGFRPLIDCVEVWVIDDVNATMIFPSLTRPIKQTSIGEFNDEVELDPGCTYLLLNRKTGLAQSDQWASYFSQKLNGLELYRLLPQEKIVELGVLPAHGLKPGWYHKAPLPNVAQPPQQTKVKVAYHAQHPMFTILVKVIEKTLSQDQLEVELIQYDIEPPDVDDIDIWVKPMGISANRDDALAGWLLNYSDIERVSPEVNFHQWQGLVHAWMEDKQTAFPAKELGRSLVHNMQIIPTFHVWLGVSKDQCGALQNAKCNALGWFDFSQVWVKPDLGSD